MSFFSAGFLSLIKTEGEKMLSDSGFQQSKHKLLGLVWGF